MKPPCIILNPAAKSGQAGNFVEVLQELPGNPVVKLTKAPRDAERLAQEAITEGHSKIVAAGGDGLINEVVNGIRQATTRDSSIQFGVLPLGTMNVFASELNIPLTSLEAAWEVILESHSLSIDLPCVTHLETQQKRFFVQLAGIGLDAAILKETTSEAKMAFGPMSYLFSFLKLIFKRPPLLLLQHQEKQTIQGSTLLLGNGKFYGGAFPFFPEAALDDGHLHALLFKNLHFFQLLKSIPALLIGKASSLRSTHSFKAKELTIIAANPHERVPFELDGEMVAYLPIKITLEKQGLSVLAP